MQNICNTVLAKINRLTDWQVAIILAILGFCVFFTGLNSPFQGDDIYQIVNNVPVHSLANVKLFFTWVSKLLTNRKSAMLLLLIDAIIDSFLPRAAANPKGVRPLVLHLNEVIIVWLLTQTQDLVSAPGNLSATG